jgi:hypothetical protein
MRTYGLSKGAVLRLLEVNGVPRRQRGLSDIQVQQPSSSADVAGH